MPANISGTDQRLTDEELVKRIKNGDKEALDALVKAYLPKVYNRVHSLVPEADAEDVTQDIFMSLVDSISSFQGKSAFSTWFHRISMNKVADYHRKIARRKEQPSENQPITAIYPWKATHDELIVKQALMDLPKKHREVLLLKFTEGLSFAEIAEKLDLTYEATRSRCRRAIEAVRDKLERDRK
jgi:RNA polymerase sigma-70 factor (ECF subfamily)